jgi:hypothetical protein
MDGIKSGRSRGLDLMKRAIYTVGGLKSTELGV